jgi:hypothetical protein
MKTKRRVLCAVVGAMMMATVGFGSELSTVDVLQPIDIENVIYLSHVTCMTFNSDDEAILAVAKTCDSNCVLSDYGSENRNAAFAAGLKVQVIFNSNGHNSLFGNTMRVVLDTRDVEAGPSKSDWPDTTVISATIQCIMVNAAISRSVRLVDLRVEGDPRYRGYGGVRSTSRYRGGQLRREFN